ncbi:hypothetical protein [Marivita geojedonensis]|nr:hypothetical protein [Marivita geojedonensis]PRY78591.1 hypothetical protein CLV76_106151 [Marivita geojedonensis]
MAYFDTRKTTGTTIGSIFDQLVKFIMARISSTPKRPGKSPHDIVAAQHRAEAHRRAVDRLMR